MPDERHLLFGKPAVGRVVSGREHIVRPVPVKGDAVGMDRPFAYLYFRPLSVKRISPPAGDSPKRHQWKTSEHWSTVRSPISILGLSKITNLHLLQKLPLTRLILLRTEVDDISPLRHLALEELDLSGTGVTSIRPLRGMPLRILQCRATPIFDLSPLQGMPIEVLRLSGSAVTDLSPLAECPVEEITLTGLGIDNLEPLSRMPLRRLTLTAKGVSYDQLDFLSGLPQLEFLGEVGDPDDQTPEIFLKRVAASDCETS